MSRTRTRKRIIVSRGLNSVIRTNAVIQDNKPIYPREVRTKYNITSNVDLHKGTESVKTFEGYSYAKDYIDSDAVMRSAVYAQDGSVIPMRRQFDFVAGKSYNNAELNDNLKSVENETLWGRLQDEEVQQGMENIAHRMFPNQNPLTNKPDIESGKYYNKYIPLVVASGVVPPQVDEEGNTYFNPNGVVSVAEFLDSINSLKSGSNSIEGRHKSLDSVSDISDFFNNGYNQCLYGVSSPFYRLYRRRELVQPITRLELAYITVICWREFTEKFGSLTNRSNNIGLNFNWLAPADKLSKFADGFDYRVVKQSGNVFLENGTKITSLNIKDYKKNLSMEEYKIAIKTGRRGIPLPAFMSMLELGLLDLFYFEDNRLDPLKEVSRGELTYFLTKLAKLFRLPYVSAGDNSI